MIDSDELRSLWDRYAARLRSFIAARVESEETAEDLLQETFLRVHTGLCCMQEWEAMERWIHRVARNLIVDHYRSRRRHETLEEEPAAAYGSPEPDEDPAAALAFSLREMVERLSGPYREALVLTEYEGLGQAAYAERAGISLPAAKSRILRARARLKELLLECCHFELDRLGGIVDYEERCAECDLARRARAGQ